LIGCVDGSAAMEHLNVIEGRQSASAADNDGSPIVAAGEVALPFPWVSPPIESSLREVK
jgi:hypothetical protein